MTFTERLNWILYLYGGTYGEHKAKYFANYVKSDLNDQISCSLDSQSDCYIIVEKLFVPAQYQKDEDIDILFSETTKEIPTKEKLICFLLYAKHIIYEIFCHFSFIIGTLPAERKIKSFLRSLY